MNSLFHMVVAGLACAVLAGAAEDERPDQQQPLTSGYASLHGDYSLGQSFVPSAATLKRIDVYLQSRAGTTNRLPVTLTLREKFAGKVLAEAVLPAGKAVPNGAWMPFEFTAPVKVTPGRSYLFRLDYPDTAKNALQLPAASDYFADPYPDGAMFSSWKRGAARFMADQDLAFKTYGLANSHAPTSHPAPTMKNFLNVDYSDNFIYAGKNNFGSRHPREEIIETLRNAKANGFNAVNWRVSFMGEALYQSKIIGVVGQYGSAAYGWVNRDDCMKNMVEAIQTVDPIAVAVEEGHKLGLEIYAWVTINDFGTTPDRLTAFFKKNPHYQWVHRDGKKFLSGVPALAYPEVRAFLLSQMRELMAYGVDGLFVSTRGHTTAFRRPTLLEYGFNEPFVAEFKRRYHTDPIGDFNAERDGKRLIRLRAELENKFYSELADLRNRDFPKVRILADLSFYPQNWPEWLQKNWVDELAVHTTSGSEGSLPSPREYRDLADFYWARTRKYGPVKLLMWLQVYSYRLRYQHSKEEITRDLAAIRASQVGGLIFHEHCAALAEPENFWPYISKVLVDDTESGEPK